MAFNEATVQDSTVSTKPGVRPATSPPLPLRILPEGSTLPFVLVVVLFFIWGMSNNLTDILVQQFRKGFHLSQLQAQMVQSAVFFGYFCMALPAALLMRRWRYKAGIIVGLCTFGVGTLLFWPAAVIGQYGPFLLALYVVGCGSAMLETAANPLVAQMGSPESSERRLNLAQAFNPPGTITGVLVGTYFIFSGVELAPQKVAQMKAAGTYAGYLHGEIMRVVPTYVALGAAVLLWALVIGLTRFPAIASGTSPLKGGSVGSFRELRAYPHLWLAVTAQFFCVGAQVTTWSAFIPYMKQYTAVTEREAGWFLTGNLVLLLIGRFASTWLMRWIRPVRMIAAYAVVNSVLMTFAVVHPGFAGAMIVMTTSFFMSMMFPTIFALGVKGLGRNTKLGGALIVMSVAGGAVLPPILGAIARASGSLALGYIVVVGAYLVILGYCVVQGRDVSLKSVERVPEVF
jgi:MFS transporter, FHS family, L-fucose permease